VRVVAESTSGVRRSGCARDTVAPCASEFAGLDPTTSYRSVTARIISAAELPRTAEVTDVSIRPFLKPA
jgi:hypothetical protein